MYLTQTQINKLREKVESNMSTDIKLSKAQTNKLTILPILIKLALSLGKNTLAPLGLSAAMSATDPAIQKNIYAWFRNKNSKSF